MLKFNCFLLTVTLSFFTLILSKTEGTIAYKIVDQSEDIRIDSFHNTSAISTNNSFHERLGFIKQKLTSGSLIFSFTYLRDAFLEEGLSYLKVCNLIDLNLTTRTIIYPFHSFL